MKHSGTGVFVGPPEGVAIGIIGIEHVVRVHVCSSPKARLGSSHLSLIRNRRDHSVSVLVQVTEKRGFGLAAGEVKSRGVSDADVGVAG